MRAAIVATYLLLRFTQRRALSQYLATEAPVPVLTAAGKMAAVGITATAVVLLAASATAIAVLIRERKWPWSMTHPAIAVASPS